MNDLPKKTIRFLEQVLAPRKGEPSMKVSIEAVHMLATQTCIWLLDQIDHPAGPRNSDAPARMIPIVWEAYNRALMCMAQKKGIIKQDDIEPIVRELSDMCPSLGGRNRNIPAYMPVQSLPPQLVKQLQDVQMFRCACVGSISAGGAITDEGACHERPVAQCTSNDGLSRLLCEGHAKEFCIKHGITIPKDSMN